MSRNSRFVRSVWVPTCCALAVALAGCGDGEGDSSEDTDPSAEGDDDSSDDDSDEGSPKDASARDAATSSVRDGATAGRDAGTQTSPPARDASVPRMTDASSGARLDASAPPPPPPPVGDGAVGMSVSGVPEAELAMLRQVCVDEINMYRATLMIAPIQRASPAQELCSDQGAKKDGESKMAHSSSGRGNPCVVAGARPAFPGFSSQNTCPDWPVGRGATTTIAAALKGCLKAMWNEGEPPEGIEKCIADYRAGNTKCFLAHGHYINMKGNARGVSCGFFKTGANTYWMNQDFF
jgi:hypothetical protein